MPVLACPCPRQQLAEALHGWEEGRDTLETVDVGAEDSERELIGRLAALAKENTSLGTALEAAQRLVDHRQTVDELIGQALRDAMGLDRLREEVQELEAQRETLGEILEQDRQAVEEQLQQLASSLEGVMDLLPKANDSMQELEGRLGLLLGRVEAVRMGGRQVEAVAGSSAELEGWDEGESLDGGQAEEDEVRSPAEASLDEIVTPQEQDAQEYTGQLGAVSEEEQPEAKPAEWTEGDSLGGRSGEVADASMREVPVEEDGGTASREGEPEGVQKAAPEKEVVAWLEPGESWVVGTKKDIDDSTKHEEGDKAEDEGQPSWRPWWRI